jgi:hypothetical protein
MYLLGEKYISSIQQVSLSDNSKIVLLPADLQATLKGLMGK